MKFSIIICTYNSSKSLPKTLDSVLAQTFDDYEVIIIDSISTDGTMKIVKEYEANFKERLRCISEKDNGIYDGMNKGIKIARGEWLYFLGSGDVFYENCILEKIAEKIEILKADVIYGSVELENTGVIYDRKFTSKKLMKGNISHQAIFFKKNIFDIFGHYDTKYRTLADWVFNMRWFNRKEIKCKYVDIVVAKFELDGVSKKIYDKNFYLDFESNLNQYFSNCDIEEFRGMLKLGYILFKNEKFWRFWKWKNRMILIMKNPRYFIKRRLNFMDKQL